MENDYLTRAKEIIADIIYLTLATVSAEGEPWNSPVYSAYDKNYNFYWSSASMAQHSVNIKANGQVFTVIYASKAPEGTGEGVYIKGRAEELEKEKEIGEALALLYGRKNKPAPLAVDFMVPNLRRVYKLVPEQVWMNSDEKDGDYHVDTRIEVKLI